MSKPIVLLMHSGRFPQLSCTRRARAASLWARNDNVKQHAPREWLNTLFSEKTVTT